MFFSRFFVTLHSTYYIISMKKLYLLLTIACLATQAVAQEKFELGKPNNDAYRYLDNYQALKNYINYDKYPNFKLGIGIIENDYLSTYSSLVKNMVNKNFTEFVAGNAMKMGSVVNDNGDMNFTTVKKLVAASTSSGLNLYGHVLVWHSQQPIGWLTKLMADKEVPGAESWQTVASKDLRTNQTVSFKANETEFCYTISFNATDGLKVTTTKAYGWQIQFVPIENIPLKAGKTFKMTMTIKGSKAGKLNGHLGNWSTNNDGDNKTGTDLTVNFTSEWKDVEVNVVPTIDTNFLLLHVPNYIGDVYIKSIKFEGNVPQTAPQTAQERHDTLVYAMDKWIKSMMEACDGKVKAWDLVNEAIGGGGEHGEDVDEQGNYNLQHSTSYKEYGTWDVGGSNFFWQDNMGDLDYVRQACRLARKYGPEDIKLFVNDYNLEGIWDLTPKDGITASQKMWSMIGWLKKWEDDKVTHIDGIGTQMHINYYDNEYTRNNQKTAITGMFQLMAKSGKLVRVSEMDMGYIIGSWPNEQKLTTGQLSEDQHKDMANFYEWIIKEYFRIIPPEQQWGICQWCATDSPDTQYTWRRNEPAGIWDLSYYRKHVYAGFVRGLNGGEPTGIQKVEIDKGIDTSKGIYNLNGMRLKATSLDELPSGLYIVNGKKVVK